MLQVHRVPCNIAPEENVSAEVKVNIAAKLRAPRSLHLGPQRHCLIALLHSKTMGRRSEPGVICRGFGTVFKGECEHINEQRLILEPRTIGKHMSWCFRAAGV